MCNLHKKEFDFEDYDIEEVPKPYRNTIIEENKSKKGLVLSGLGLVSLVLKNDLARLKNSFLRYNIPILNKNNDNLDNIALKEDLRMSLEKIYKQSYFEVARKRGDLGKLGETQIRNLFEKFHEKSIRQSEIIFENRRGKQVNDLNSIINSNINLRFPSEQKQLFSVFQQTQELKDRYSSALVGFNESTSSFEQSKSEIAKETKKFKEWICVFFNSRQAHMDAHKQRVEIDDFFLVGGENLEYPGDPSASLENKINCQCTSMYV